MNFKEADKRITFTNKQIDMLFSRLERMEKAIQVHEEDLMLASRSMDEFEERMRELKRLARTEKKKKLEHKLRMIQNNLQSVTQQLKEREPRPFIPPETWEAFEEFLVKINHK